MTSVDLPSMVYCLGAQKLRFVKPTPEQIATTTMYHNEKF